jgi:hypothetical protein
MNLLTYLLAVNISLFLFYCLYRISLARETFFKFNRFYLLATLFLSFSVPCLTVINCVPASITRSLVLPISYSTHVPLMHTLYFDVYHCMLYMYATGTVLSAGLLIQKLLGLRKLLSDTDNRAFSFLKWKVIDSRNPDYIVINAHEQAHIEGLHTADVILFELAAVLVWFNPIIYLLKIEIKSVHEYLADQAALKHTNDARQYAYLLLNGAMGVSPVLTHSFQEKSMLKKRIYMLQRRHSSRWVALRYLLAVPMLALIIICCSLTNATSSVNNKMGSNSTAPEFPGGMKRFTAYIHQAIRHSSAFTQRGDSKPIWVSFIIDQDGSVTSVTTTGSTNNLINQEAIHILEDSPKWRPGLADGVPVRVQYQIKLAYQQKLGYSKILK